MMVIGNFAKMYLFMYLIHETLAHGLGLDFCTWNLSKNRKNHVIGTLRFMFGHRCASLDLRTVSKGLFNI